MNTSHTTPTWWATAQARGWVAAPALQRPSDEEPAPWLVAMLMLGAMLCMASALGLLALMLGEVMLSGLGYGLAGLMWGGAVLLLRAQPPLFVQCLAVVGVGTASIWLGALMGDLNHLRLGLPWLAVGVIQAVLLVLSALAVRMRWVQQLCGVSAVGWLVLGVMAGLEMLWGHRLALLATPVLVLAVAWGLAMAAEARWAGQAEGGRWAALGDGMAAGLLGAVAVLSQLMGLEGLFRAQAWDGAWLAMLASVLSVLGFGAALVRRWQRAAVAERAMRQATMPPEAVPDAGWPALAWLTVALATLASAAMPWMAPVAVVAAVAAMGGRWRLLLASGVVALLVMGRFYYDLSWPLAIKGLGLAVVGLVLAVALLLWRGRTQAAAVPGMQGAASRSSTGRRGLLPLVLGALLCLGLVNLDVWRKEQVVAHGEAIWVPLMPVDPRSLMQGDYMDLRFDIPQAVLSALADAPDQALRSWADVVVQRDAKGQAKVLRLATPGEALAADERRMPLKRLKGRWTLVTDAYFFPEGQGQPFEAARFGEFRVLPDGRALLVGLSDAQAQAIRAPADLRD